MTVAVHVEDIRGATVRHHHDHSAVDLRLGAFNRLTLVLRSSAKARIIAEAVNADVAVNAPRPVNSIRGA